MNERAIDPTSQPSAAFTPDKEAWKKAGNRYDAESLRAMQDAAKDELVIIEIPEPVFDANQPRQR